MKVRPQEQKVEQRMLRMDHASIRARKGPKQGVHDLHLVRNFTRIFTQHDGVTLE